MSLRRLLAAIALALCSPVAVPAPAYAHASLIATDPADGAVVAEPPDAIRLTFDEPVSVVEQGVRLFDAAGTALVVTALSEDRVVKVMPTERLGGGTYVVTYRVVSADSHPIAGSLSFSVGTPSGHVAPVDSATPGSVAPLRGALQGLAYVAVLLASGLAVFLVVLLPRQAGAELRTRLRVILRRASAVAVGSAVLLVPVGVAYERGLGFAGLGTADAWTAWASADGLVALLVTAGLVGASALARRLPGLALLSAALAVVALAVVGHTRTFGPAWLVVGADVLHCAAAATWFGGLVGLALSLRRLPSPLAARTVARFSVAAGGLLAAVASAGVVLGWRIVGSWSALASTSYGLTLLAKVALVGLVVAVAGWNRYRLVPRVSTGGVERLRTTMRAEVALLVPVLVLTGFLGTESPRADHGAGPVDRVVAADEHVRVVGRLFPNRAGANQLTLHLERPGGRPFTSYSVPTVSFSCAGIDLGSRPTRSRGHGTYQARVVVPRPGRCSLRVNVRTSEFDSSAVVLTSTVAPRS